MPSRTSPASTTSRTRVLVLRSRDEARRFLRDLCTLGELEALAHRWQIARLVDAGRRLPRHRRDRAHEHGHGHAGRPLAAPRRRRLCARARAHRETPGELDDPRAVRAGRRERPADRRRALEGADAAADARPLRRGRPQLRDDRARAARPLRERARRPAARAAARHPRVRPGRRRRRRDHRREPRRRERGGRLHGRRARLRALHARGGGAASTRRSTTLADLEGLRVATAYPTSTRRCLDGLGVAAELVTISGAVEAAPRLGLADAIVDLVSTGSTASANGLRRIGRLLESQAVLLRGRERDARQGRARRAARAHARGGRGRPPPALRDDERAGGGAGRDPRRAAEHGRAVGARARRSGADRHPRRRSRPTRSGTCCRRSRPPGRRRSSSSRSRGSSREPGRNRRRAAAGRRDRRRRPRPRGRGACSTGRSGSTASGRRRCACRRRRSPRAEAEPAFLAAIRRAGGGGARVPRAAAPAGHVGLGRCRASGQSAGSCRSARSASTPRAGGRRYPSSLVMAAVPAQLAGVRGSRSSRRGRAAVLLATARELGIDEVYAVGGAQAIAALAYGTETMPAVDKIVGPGNRWVTAAKLLVSGRVGDRPPGRAQRGADRRRRDGRRRSSARPTCSRRPSTGPTPSAFSSRRARSSRTTVERARRRAGSRSRSRSSARSTRRSRAPTSTRPSTSSSTSPTPSGSLRGCGTRARSSSERRRPRSSATTRRAPTTCCRRAVSRGRRRARPRGVPQVDPGRLGDTRGARRDARDGRRARRAEGLPLHAAAVEARFAQWRGEPPARSRTASRRTSGRGRRRRLPPRTVSGRGGAALRRERAAAPRGAGGAARRELRGAERVSGGHVSRAA